MVKIMDYHQTAPAGFTRDTLPYHCFRGTPPVPHVCLPDVVIHWRAVIVDFKATAHVFEIHHLMRVTQPVRVDNLQGGRKLCFIVSEPIREVLQIPQRVTVHQLVPESQT